MGFGGACGHIRCKNLMEENPYKWAVLWLSAMDKEMVVMLLLLDRLSVPLVALSRVTRIGRQSK